jgi:outer membrane protein OmpA-like peptidoglycan-associated protein
MERYTRTAIVLSCLLTLVGCSFNPFSKDNQLTGSATSTAVGAGAGAGSMLLLDAPKPLVALGAAGGAVIGYYVSTLRFASGGVIRNGGQVFTVGDYVTIEIPTDNLFDTNSADFLPEADPVLKSAADVLSRYPNHNILISGNTSGFGSAKFEQKLSEARARQVAAYLWANGVNTFEYQSVESRRKLVYTGYGDYFPISNNIRATSIRENSRIQITAYPLWANLKIGKRAKIFNNIGDLDEPHLSKEKQPIDFNRVFPPGNTLPEAGYSRREDFKEAFAEGPPRNTVSPFPTARPSYIPERGDLRGDSMGSYSNISKDAQTSGGGSVSKQGGYKGEAYKDG